MEETYQALRSDWFGGSRDRETALHLLFLSWWHWAEPEFLTGLTYDPASAELWHEVFNHFGGQASEDAEFLFVAAIMAGITPWAFGDENEWTAAAAAMMAHARSLQPDELSPGVFEGRSAYGDYFAHQSRVHSGEY
ncbi:hypothetical protein SAMN06297144_0737 [Sphingomonas guangdongensis]|uniref:Uncharacterized protein n=1 Tax=Sphingomonas guangdongensis TaxID=1141890 RepID=A0A285QE53_9SPHN|nr:hypothetical protein [Sphingomonas guangdongensis]SOB79798.1 hypothetical protein SAMN06297144_0737 [Sphingomonas guangdongensis]